MSKLPLTLAISDYDHVRDLTTGRVVPEGIDLNCLDLTVEEIFFRFVLYREWDVSEISMAKYVSLISQGDTTLTAIPVFPSRIFRHSSFYVRRDGPVKSPADLAGRRVGLPEWAQTAAVYTRGLLMHQYGLDLASIHWVQAGVNQPGRSEKVGLRLPPGVTVTAAPRDSLSEMLVSGQVDAVLSAHAPDCFEHGHPNIKRLFDNVRALEADYYRETGIFPIMHTVALRKEVVERHPWIATNLLKAFDEAKRRSVERVLDICAPRMPLPWCHDFAAEGRAMFGDDYFPYGIEPNRRTLEAFLLYAYEQGVCHRHLAVEELFPVQVGHSFKV